MRFRHLRNVRGFFSDYYLGSVFGRGNGRGRARKLSDRESDLAYRRFRRIRDRAEGRAAEAPTCREKFVRPLLRDVLGYHLGEGEDGLYGLYPSAEHEQAGERALLLSYCGAWDEDLDAGRGRGNPTRRLAQGLARSDLPYGLLLTGERARLVRQPGDGPRGAYLEVDLAGVAEEDDPESFAAFLRLFSVVNFVPDEDGRRPIEDLEEESREHAERVSEDLKEAVFTAAESMVAGLIADAVARGELSPALDLDEAGLRAYRDAALLALYRILFILYAETRDPRLDDHTLYRESYSAEGLLEEVLRDPERDWPENRCSLWERLLALFRIYDEGLPPISPWEHIPPRGGDFFSPETPAGRILEAARLSDCQVAQLIVELATTTPRRGVGRERVSFRELDIENLGAVYEGLLEYEPRVLRETAIELRLQGRDFVLSPEDLVRLCEQKNLGLCGGLDIVRGTAAELLHPEAPENEEELPEAEDDVAVPDPAGEETEGEGIKKGATARLVRRLEPGTFHFVPGPGRKGSGSFYTPRALVQDLVRHALGPQVDGKTAADIERLRVLDPACGSAHFLVAAMRFLGQALHRAYVREYNGKAPPEFRSTTGQGWDDNWQASDEEARAGNSEARAWCKRRIAERCLFGVDLNPTAVQLARVALWIESVAGDRPLTYFEHHIRCGNSLLGSWMARLEEPTVPAREKSADPQQGFFPFQEHVRRAVEEAARLRRTIDEVRPEDLRREGIEPDSTEEQHYKDHLRRKAEETLEAARLLFDLRSASAFVPKIWHDWEALCSRIGDPGELRRYSESRPWWAAFEEVRGRERFFHWELEFPEVFLYPENPGFDALLGNPPWDKIKPDRKEFYGRYDILIRALVGGELDKRIKELQRHIPALAAEFKAYETRLKTLARCLKKGGDYRFQDWEIDGKKTGGDPDAFKFFVERAWQLTREGGRVGFVVPSALYNNEGCTGLRHLLLKECAVERFYAFENRRKIFPIHSSYKFVSLVFRRGARESVGFEAAFMRHQLAELNATARQREPGREKVKAFKAPWIVSVRRPELERLSPGTLAFLEYRSPRDRETVLKMYGYDPDGNPVSPRPLLGDRGPGTWNARFYTEFHMTNDRDLWTDPRTGKLFNPRQILGPVPGTTDRPPYYDSDAWPDVRAAMAEKGFWPLYQDAHIHQLTDNFKPFMRWLSLQEHERKYHRLPEGSEKLVIRDRTRATDERTIIAAVLPERSAFGHTLNGVGLDGATPHALCWLLNSLSFDFLARFWVAGQHASPYLLRRVASLSAARVGQMGTAALHDARFSQSTPYDVSSHWNMLVGSELTVAEAYGLTPDDFEHVLSSFPVFARKRPEFFAYVKQRLEEWKRELSTKRVVHYLPEDRQTAPKVAEDRAPRDASSGST